MEAGPDMGHTRFLGALHAGGPDHPAPANQAALGSCKEGATVHAEGPVLGPQSFACGQRWEDAGESGQEEDAPFQRAIFEPTSDM